MEAELTKLGFEPALESDGSDGPAARIEFLHCPFRELAEAYPELVCNLHRGLCEGVVDADCWSRATAAAAPRTSP